MRRNHSSGAGRRSWVTPATRAPDRYKGCGCHDRPVATHRVAVTCTVHVEDGEALLRAGAAAWEASTGGWAVCVDDDRGAQEASSEEAAAVVPGPEAGIALLLGAQPYPTVPGVSFGASSVDVQPGAPSE